jgi:DNA-binding response OmpR family regulator
MLDLEMPLAIACSEHATETGDGPFAPEAQEPRKIVIVDDNRDAADALGVHLQAAGYQVIVTYSGKEAWQKCKEFVPSAMVVDIGMPRLNGFQLARRIRRTGWGMRALLIAVTGWGRSGDTELAKFVGFDHYCEKPIDFVEIERLVQSTTP